MEICKHTAYPRRSFDFLVHQKPNFRFKSDNNPATYGAVFKIVGQIAHFSQLLWVVTA